MAEYPAFIDGSYTSQSPIADQEDLINWYVEKMQAEGATTPNSLYPAPGFRARYTVSAVGGRAMFTDGTGRCFGVIGTTLEEFLADGTTVIRGTVAIDGNPATICSNGDGGGQILITSGDKAYCFDLASNVLTEVLSSGATMGGMLYGYFVVFDAVQSRVQLSDLFDGLTWDPTQFFQRTIGSDPWTAMLVTPYGQIFLPGSQTGEFWYNAGTFPIPFAPDPSGLIEEGIAATFSLKQAGKSAVWLSTNKNGGYQVMRASGFSPEPISNNAIDFQISQYARVDDALGETYEDQGHAFYLLTFPTARVTWVFDFATSKWHKRGTWIAEMNTYTYLRPVFHCFAFNKHLMADRETGVVYEQSINFATDIENRPMRRVRRAPALVSQNKRLFFPKLELLLETGLGLQTGQGSDPIVMMRKSDDGGQTWGNERQASAGRIGKYAIRCQWFNTGSGRKRVFEVSVTDPIINWRVSEAYLRVAASQEAA